MLLLHCHYCCCNFFYCFCCYCSHRHHITSDGIIKFNINSTTNASAVANDLAVTTDIGSHQTEGASSTNKLADACTALGCDVKWRLCLVVARSALVTSAPQSVNNARSARLTRFPAPFCASPSLYHCLACRLVLFLYRFLLYTFLYFEFSYVCAFILLFCFEKLKIANEFVNSYRFVLAAHGRHTTVAETGGL